MSKRYNAVQELYTLKCIPRDANKLTPLNKLQRKDVLFELTHRLKSTIFNINEDLLKASKLSLEMPLPEKLLAIMCNASQYAAGFVLLTEDYKDTVQVGTGSLWL